MRFWLAVVLIAGSVEASGTAGAASPFTLQVSPGVALAPANVMVRARVPKDADNRALEIEMDSGQFFRSTMVTLEGDTAPSITEVPFRNLPGGEYQVSVVLLGSRGVRGTLSRTITVIPSASER